MSIEQELAHARAVLAAAAQALDAANARVRATRLVAEQAERDAAAAYRVWQDASEHRARLVVQRLAAAPPTRRPGATAPAGSTGPGGATGPAGPPGPDRPAAGVLPWEGPPGEPVRSEASAWSVQTVLLALGGVLLAVAAVVFTVVAWGAFGIGGRAAILAGITALTFAAPALLHRRGLGSTAETIALLGLVLLALDGYAVRHVGWVSASVDPAGYAGLVLGLAAVVALTYPVLVPVRTLRPAGLVLAHPAAVLGAAPFASDAAQWAILGSALVALDLGVRWYVPGAVMRGVAGVCCGIAGVLSVPVAVAAAGLPESGPGARIVGALVLTGLAAAVVVAAETVRSGRTVARGVAAAVAVPLTIGGPLLLWLRYGPDGWGPTGSAVLVALGAVVTRGTRMPWRAGSGAVVAVLAAGAGLAPLTAVGFTLLAPLVSPDLVWGAATVTRPAWAVAGTRPDADAVGVLIAVVVAAVFLVLSAGGRLARRAALGVAGVGAGAVAVLTPAAAAAPLWVSVLVSAAIAAATTTAGVLRPWPEWPTLLGAGGVFATHAVLLALASREATLVTLGVVAAGYGLLAVRTTGTRQAGAVGVALGALGGWGAAVATALTAGTGGWVGGPGPAGVALGLTGGGALGVAAATRAARPASATVAAIVAGVAGYVGAALAALTPGAPGVVGTVDREVIAVLALAAAGLAAAAVRTVTPPAARATPAAAAAAAPGALVAALALAPALAAVVLGPLTWVRAVWAGAPEDAAGLGPALTYPGSLLDAVVLLGAAAVLLGVRWSRGRRTVRWLGVLVTAPGVMTLAPALHAPWALALGVLLALTAAGAAIACTPDPAPGGTPADPSGGGRRIGGAVLAVVTGATAIAWALADRTATLAVLTLVLIGAVAVVLRAPGTGPRCAGAATAALAAVGLAFAVSAATGVPAAYLLVGVATLAVLPGVLAAPRVLANVFDAGAAATGSLALIAAVAGARPDQPVLAVTATLLGLPLGLAGLHPARRWCHWLVPVVELGALWAWLARAGVDVPEAYTLPAAALAAAFGLYTLRRRPALSSWVALGPALTVAAVPTLAVALTAGVLGLRVLLLGVAALAVTLAGAATRRQAPFLLGAGVLTLVAARALAPALPALAETVPTWVPLSLAGALLLAVGATYERRRRDAARVMSYIRALQ